MKNKPFFVFLFLIFIIGGYYFTLINNVDFHEQAHARIMDYYGCKNVSVKFSVDKLSGSTSCKDITHNEIESETILHSLNEIVNYNIRGLFSMMFVGIIAIGMLITGRKSE